MLKNLLSIYRFVSTHPLAAQRKIKTLRNIFCWQIGARLLRKKVVVPWVEESKFITGLGETGLTGNMYAGFMEYADMLFLLHALQPDETFVDVGANVGAYTILASGVVKSASIAFEPLPETADRLMDQIQINRMNDRVCIKNKGVGAKKETLYFTNNSDTINKVSLKGEADNTTQIEVVALDEELDLGKKYFFKIDVEGFEYNVLEGAQQILSAPDTSALIIELNGSGVEFGHDNEKIHQRILDFNFHPVSYEPVTRTLTRLQSYNRDGGNTIYVKDVMLMSARCQRAPKRSVHTAASILL